MDKFIFKVNRQKFESVNAIITGKEVLGIASLLPVEDYELLIKVWQKSLQSQHLLNQFFHLIELVRNLFHLPYKKLLIYVDDEPVEVDECFMTPNEILTAAGKNANGFYLKQISGHKEVSYKNDREHKVAIKNGLKFSSCKLEPTTVS